MLDVLSVAATRDLLGESPIWSVAEQAIYWVDIRAPKICRLDPATGRLDEWTMPSAAGSIALRKAGGLLVALQTGICTFDPATRDLQVIADPEPDTGNRFNDGRCDRAGRFWVGTMFDGEKKPAGALYRLGADRKCERIFGDVFTPNSLCWSPDDRTMYFADTFHRRITAFDFSIRDGTVSNPRVFADLSRQPGNPDGSAVDEQGFLWNAEYGGSRVVRYSPDGSIDRAIELPVTQPTCCCFGGPNLDTLYVTSARQRLTDAQLAREPLAGNLFAVNVGVRGLPEAQFAG